MNQIITEVAELKPETMVVIKRDGIPQTDAMRFEDTLSWFHQHSSQSMDWALRYEGYSVHQEIFRVSALQYDNIENVEVKFTQLAAKRRQNVLSKDIGTLYKATEWRRITGPAITF